jgi:uncharacterized protein YbjQ (UPF0145 family)
LLHTASRSSPFRRPVTRASRRRIRITEPEEGHDACRHNDGHRGERVIKYFGVVSGEAILGANIFQDFFAGIRDIVGGRSAAYERELKKAKDIAIAEMVQQAQALGGNAVLGVDLDYETIGANGSMLMVSASGTAVQVE